MTRNALMHALYPTRPRCQAANCLGAVWLPVMMSVSSASAQSTLRFLASPYHVREGDGVTFQYLDQKSNVLKRTNTAGWAWAANPLRRSPC